MSVINETTYEQLQDLYHNTRRRKLGNNTVFDYDFDRDCFNIYLHGHNIVKVFSDGIVKFTLAGWNTVTTRQRVNQFIGINRIHTIKYEAYLNGNPIFSDEWYTVEVKRLQDAIIDGKPAQRFSLREVYNV